MMMQIIANHDDDDDDDDADDACWVAPSQSEFNDIESMTDNDKTFHSWRTHSAFFTVMFSWPSKSKSACLANRAKPLCDYAHYDRYDKFYPFYQNDQKNS